MSIVRNFWMFVLALGPLAGHAEQYAIKKCLIKFETTGSPVLVKIHGTSKKPCQGTVEVANGVIKSGVITLPMDDIDTGIPLRNKHLRENYIFVDKFPTSTIKLTSAENLADQLAGKASGASKYAGTLTMKGKEAAIRDGTYKIDGKSIEAKLSVDLGDHEVEKPSFMGVKVVDLVFVTVEIEI